MPGAGTALGWIWLLAIIGFFSIPHSKIIGYALPVMPPLALLAALGWDDAMARLKLGAPAQARWFAALCVVSIGIAIGANLVAAEYTKKYATQDIAQALEAAGAQPSDTVYLLNDFAYDLPFYRRASTHMVVLQDWPALRQSPGDDWQHEMLEGADFAPPSAGVLKTPRLLALDLTQRGERGVWVLARHKAELGGFVRVFVGRAWSLYKPLDQGTESAPESPEAAEEVSLGGGAQQG